jgi:hypothetical protein
MQLSRAAVSSADALIVADYLTREPVLSRQSQPSVLDLAQWNPALTIVQIAGPVDVDECRRVHLKVYPDRGLAPHRMSFTLDHVGARPVIALFTAGLKAAEVVYRQRQQGLDPGEFTQLVQVLT